MLILTFYWIKIKLSFYFLQCIDHVWKVLEKSNIIGNCYYCSSHYFSRDERLITRLLRTRTLDTVSLIVRWRTRNREWNARFTVERIQRVDDPYAIPRAWNVTGNVMIYTITFTLSSILFSVSMRHAHYGVLIFRCVLELFVGLNTFSDNVTTMNNDVSSRCRIDKRLTRNLC